MREWNGSVRICWTQQIRSRRRRRIIGRWSRLFTSLISHSAAIILVTLTGGCIVIFTVPNDDVLPGRESLL